MSDNIPTPEKIITYEDRADLLDLRSMVEDFDSAPAQRQTALIDRLIAAAEADAPPLPEGWVLWEIPGGKAYRIVWHSNGCLYVYSDHSGPLGDFHAVRDRLTPLLPTFTGRAR